MKTKFMPGPYDIGKYSAKYTYPSAIDYDFDAMSIADENLVQRAIIPMDGKDWERHMHLIAADPDLFRLLNEAKLALPPEFNYSLIRDIDRAIAKALGEPS